VGNTPRFSSFLGGRWRSSASDHWIPDLNPSNPEDVIGLVPRGTLEDIATAVSEASAALSAWRGLAGPARAEHLHKWATVIGQRQEDLAQAVTREVGKPITEARAEVSRCVVILRYYAGEAVRAIGEVVPSQSPTALQFTLRQPLGVVALITPWNFPLAIPLWKVAPALAFGNTVVLKPAEASSHTATFLAGTAEAAGLPPGVFNVLLGSGPVVGAGLLSQGAVRGVSFTGSVGVGAQVGALASQRNIRFQTEMGGKNVAIVLPDSDSDLAASLVASGAMRFAGQKCTATSRVVVVRGAEEPFLTRLREQVAALPLGPVTDPSAAVGPLISEASRQRVLTALEGTSSSRLFGGGAVEGPGYFFHPTVLWDVPLESPAATDELFGPVLAGFPAEDLEHAIALANQTPYGLSAALFTRDIRSAVSYIHRIEAGLVRVNGDTTGVDPHAPFGGLKASSSWTREQGTAAREFYTEIKTVQVNA
jgi:acyl-CoA reductase-like NAD-dependent aldehyde dehydrogenase